MLASVTPLGERSRGFSWRVTTTAFVVGAIASGAIAGAGAGAVGSLLPVGPSFRTVSLGVALWAMLMLDATALGRRLPTSRRQVNEDWLRRYRGWVYGIGFGAQLGVGVVTVVTSAAVYAAVAVELLSASPVIGAAIGCTFGAVRALSLLPARIATDRDGLVELHRRIGQLEPTVRRALVVPEVLAVITVIGWVA